MPRWLHMFVAVLVLLAVSGAPAMAATVLRADPCCADEAPAEPDDDCPDSGGQDCSPFCHACACFSPYAGVERLAPVVSPLLPTGAPDALAFVEQLPPGPPPPAVFHPPRRA